VGVFLVTTAAATVTVTAIALLVITGQPRPGSDPLGAAVAQISAGKSGLALASARREVIMQTAATEAFTVSSKPKISSASSPLSSQSGGSGGASAVNAPAPDPGTAQSIAYGLLSSYGFAKSQWGCLDDLWEAESGWVYNAENASGAYGIPQALPGSKMASAGPDWETDPTTQIKWGLGYIQSTYGTPCGAWDHEEADGWY
jgi:resuscitation-promoting factor RpfB